MRQNHKHGNFIEWLLQSGFILGLIVLIFLMMFYVGEIQGTARVVNYAGIVRGATQRLVKLEICGVQDKALEERLDFILRDLKYGGGNYNLVALADENYMEKLDALSEHWEVLKAEIQTVRELGVEQSDILAMSEEYFVLADETVSAAEQFSQKCASRIRMIETALIVLIVGILVILVKQSIGVILLDKKNRELSKKAYIDLHTGLPNKSHCEELLHGTRDMINPTYCVMFDLNGLKKVNDTLGHLAGDTLIMNFASILRKCIPEKDFVGRYGGDEFIAVISGGSEPELQQILADVEAKVQEYNQFSRQVQMSYAYGYACSQNYRDCTLQVLLEKADKNMYECKSVMKEKILRDQTEGKEPKQ